MAQRWERRSLQIYTNAKQKYRYVQKLEVSQESTDATDIACNSSLTNTIQEQFSLETVYAFWIRFKFYKAGNVFSF